MKKCFMVTNVLVLKELIRTAQPEPEPRPAGGHQIRTAARNC